MLRSETIKYLVVLLVYGLDHRQKAIAVTREVCGRVFGCEPVRIVVVNNNPDQRNPTDLVGDNEFGEFSGWDTALRHLTKDNFAQEFPGHYLVLANDSFGRNTSRRDLARFNSRIRRHLDPRAVLGLVDELYTPLFLSDVDVSSKYVRTSLVIMGASVVGAIESFVHPFARQLRAGGFGAGETLLPPGVGLNTGYISFIDSWLRNDVPILPSGLRWYKAAPLDAMNRKRLEFKTLCIVCEHLLSRRFLALGFPILNVRELGRTLPNRILVVARTALRRAALGLPNRKHS